MKKKLSYQENEFLYKLLKNLIESPSGCYVPNTDIKCPYWDLELPNSSNPDLMGECIMKKTGRVCTKLELPLVEDSLTLEVRPKKVEDYLEELDEEQKQLKNALHNVSLQLKELSLDKQSISNRIDQLEKKKINLAKQEKPNDISSDN